MSEWSFIPQSWSVHSAPSVTARRTRAVHGRLIPLGCTGRSHISWEQPLDHVMMQIETDANWEVKQEETGSRKAMIRFFLFLKNCRHVGCCCSLCSFSSCFLNPCFF